MADLSDQKATIGFLGGGNMAGALIRGLIRGGMPKTQIFVSDIDDAKIEAIRTELGVTVDRSNQKVVEKADVVILAMKPMATCKVAEGLQMFANGKLWLSVAAGITTSQLEEALGSSARVIRAMPNAPALIGRGASALCPGKFATHADEQIANALLGAVGITEIVDEAMMDAVTAVSGSGPAFVMLVIEAMTDGAVRAGLPRPIAQRLATQTVLGSAALLQETGRHPGELKDMVTSPGGTTIAGIEALESGGLRSALISAVTKAAERSRELSRT
jgi:pyrroline-5-carboxylate reductase